jgi:tripartite-type tricarboxylate transporter receptor subunit TctC
MLKQVHCLAVALSVGFTFPLITQPRAADYPAGRVTLVVPFPAGGSTDLVARLLAQHLSMVWKQAVIVDNKPGGNAMLGPTFVAKSAPDGYTLLISAPTIATAPATMKVMPIDPLKELSPISQLVEMPNVVTINSMLPFKTLRELIDYAKLNPDKLNSGTFAPGSVLTSSRFNAAAGVKMPTVGYRGEALMMAATAAGEVQVGISTPVTALENLARGQVRALAVTSDTRMAIFKDVPTSAEAGLPEFNPTAWFALLAPAGTPLELRRFISTEVGVFVKKPEVVAKLQGAGLVPKASTPEAFGAFLERETKSAIETAEAVGLEKQ